MSALALRSAANRCTLLRSFICHYTSSIQSTQERPKRGRPGHVLSTLTAELLKSGDVLDASHKRAIRIRFPDSASSSGPGAQLRYINTKEDGDVPFPPHSRGFLYYHSDAHAAPLKAGVRFRIIPDGSPASFSRGQDLLVPWGLPWEIILPQIACSLNYDKIRHRLLQEHLVTEEQLSHCADIFRGRRQIYPRYTLFRLDSTFLLTFSSAMWLTVVGDVLHSVVVEPFKESVPIAGTRLQSRWTGSALARFEASTRPEYAGRRMLHLRIVKILEPAACSEVDGYDGRLITPQEGELLTLRGGLEPWAYDVDNNGASAAALRVLWDKAGLP
ncbi:hypothetical protein C8R44DRAFT_986986 [Mycena epipterygia]|nr:hypothetical protein C8R44DRAFT_986986 [Mycena epipterygia]